MPQENPQLRARGIGIIKMKKIDFNFLLTAQEHALFGSTVDKKYQEKPHTPLTVVDGKISVKKCNEQRKRFPSLDNIIAAFYGEVNAGEIIGSFWQGGCTLEPLILNAKSKNYGQTQRDPELLYVNGAVASGQNQREFPFKRVISPPVSTDLKYKIMK